MKKISLRRLLGILTTFIMVFTMGIVPLYAAPQAPVNTLVTIHKVVGTGGFTLRDHDGRLLLPQEIADLGTNAVENNTGVKFTAWSVPEGTNMNVFDGITDEEVTASELTGDPVVLDAGKTYSFDTGIYYVRETMHPATIEDYIGVPFIMELPTLNTAGNEYLTRLHLYPKNLIEDDMPEIDKDIQMKGQDNASYDVGNIFDYLIYPKVPPGIEDYTVFKVYDTLDPTLDYMGNVEVKYNGKNGVVNLILNTDYELSESSKGIAGGTFTLTFTKDGLKKIANNRPDNQTLKDLEIKFQARINSKATMGTKIYNNAILTYNNGYFSTDETKDIPQINRPEVHTGGSQFIKVDNLTQKYDRKLSTASFTVKNSEDKYMKKDEKGNISWVEVLEDATIIYVDEFYGNFEVTGLAYGNDGTPFIYKLKEVNVPTGYIQMDDLEFRIYEQSYGDKISIDDNIKVTNVKRPIIPQTGGIGTIVFIVSGITIMGVAVVALKKKE